jgi:hypothetical protein
VAGAVSEALTLVTAPVQRRAVVFDVAEVGVGAAVEQTAHAGGSTVLGGQP